MSRRYQPKKKDLANVKVISSENFNKRRNSLRFVGSVHRNISSFITTQKNRKTGKCSFVEDTSSLSKKTKNEIVRFFSDYSNTAKSVVYLAVEKDK